MLDARPVLTMQRARGAAHVGLRASGLERLAQSGCAKAFLPRVHGPVPEVVFLNTSGGLTGGDRLSYRLDVGAGARATATTQTAERAYASAGGRAEMRVGMTVGAGGALDWLPQETILFDGAALDRETRVDLAGDARLLLTETVVLGRAAMEETVARLDVTDRRKVFREGRPVWLEPLRLDADLLARRDGTATLADARAVATLALIAPGAEDALGPLRGLLDAEGVEAAASAWDGKLIVRALAADAFPLRRLVAQLLTHLRRGPLPRVWQL